MNDIPIYIAYAEDHPMMRNGVITALHVKDERFKVFIEAENGRILIDKIAAASHQPDVCLLDINMPVMNGYEAMAEIRKQYPYIRCLAFSVYGNADMPILKMLRNGALGYLTKSVEIEELAFAVTEAYKGNYYFSPDVRKLLPKISRENIIDHIDKLFREREIEFLTYCSTELSYSRIARKMNISHKTAENYATHIKEKLGVGTRTELAMYAMYSGLSYYDRPIKIQN